MKWVTHQTAAVAAAFLLHLSPAGLAAAVVGGILPDVFDQKLAGLFRNRQKAFNRIHRGFTHWPGLWLALLFLPFMPATEGALRPVLLQAGFGCALGGLSHVVLDMLTPQGVPLLPFTRKNRFSLKLCKTGGIGEYVFLASMLAAMWLFLGDVIADQLKAAMTFFFGM